MKTEIKPNLRTLAYVVGVGIGDGNLSNPNKRATRLRVSCDTKYQKLIEKIKFSIMEILPNNKVSIVYRNKNCVDVSCYSNRWEKWLGWSVGGGSKLDQKVRIPSWIMKKEEYSISCLRGLFETDGSVYLDRGYLMAMFVTTIPELAEDVMMMINKIGVTAKMYSIKQLPPSHTRYNIRVSKNVANFVNLVGIQKK